MTRVLLPLALAACTPLTCERVWLDPVTGLYGCERPTATLPTTRGEGTDRRETPGTDPEPPERDDTEPDRATDPEGWAGWKDTHPTGWRGK